MIFTRAGDIRHSLTPITAVKFRTGFTRGTNIRNGETWVVRHCHERGLAKTRVTFEANPAGVHRLVGFKIIQRAAFLNLKTKAKSGINM